MMFSIVCYHNISYLIIWYHIIWYHIKWYHIIWYHIICYMISCHMLSYHMISWDMIWYHMIWCHMLSYDSRGCAAAETGSNNGKPNFFHEFWLWKMTSFKKIKFSRTCLPWSGMKFCLEKWSDHVLIFLLDPVYALQTF